MKRLNVRYLKFNGLSSSLMAADRGRSSQPNVQGLSVKNLGRNVSVAYFLACAYSAWNRAMHRVQVRNVLVHILCSHYFGAVRVRTNASARISPHRCLISTLAVRFLRSVLSADLKIRSVGLFSVHGVSVQFHPHHTLVSHRLCLLQLLSMAKKGCQIS